MSEELVEVILGEASVLSKFGQDNGEVTYNGNLIAPAASKTAWNDAAEKRHSHANKTALDSVTADVVANSHTHANAAALAQVEAANLHTHDNKTVLDSVTADVVSNSHTHANKTALDSVTADVVSNSHSHTNKTALDKIGEENGVPKYDGAAVVVEAPDTLATLELNTAYDTLLVRPDWQDVPVYNITSNETVAELCDSGDHIMRLIYLIDEVTGMPCPELFIKTGGVSYVCLSATYHDIGSVTRQAGWYTVDDMEYIGTTPPTITNMTFTTLEVAKDGGMPDAYTSLSSLPAKAQCALETLCRMVNVSVDAMGGLGVKTDGVQRLVNAPQAGKRYAFSTEADLTFPLPAVSWTGRTQGFWVDLHCTSTINLTFSDTVAYEDGNNVDTTRGRHRLHFYVSAGADMWTVAESESYTEITEDYLPEYTIPFRNCTADQIRAVLKLGFSDGNGNWCVRRKDGIIQTWFSIGDTRPVTLTDGQEVTMRIIGIDHDDLPNGGKAALTCDFVEVLPIQEITLNYPSTSEYRTKIQPTVSGVIQIMPPYLRSIVSKVRKYWYDSSYFDDYIWLMSVKELGINTGSDDYNATYAYFTDAESKKKADENGTLTNWMLRDWNTGNYWGAIDAGGRSFGLSSGTRLTNIAPAFCLNA